MGRGGIFGGELGMAYLGTQGDIWDAHKDMALASLGALIAMVIIALINWRMQRDFAREWAESIRVKRKKPLGEEAMVNRSKEVLFSREPPAPCGYRLVAGTCPFSGFATCAVVVARRFHVTVCLGDDAETVPGRIIGLVRMPTCDIP